MCTPVFLSCVGSACINAVFYGRKVDSDKEKDGPSSSMTSNTSLAATSSTRKHILTVSTYQVGGILFSHSFLVIILISAVPLPFSDVCPDAI